MKNIFKGHLMLSSVLVLTALGLAGQSAAPAAKPAQPQMPPMTVEKITDNIYLAKGGFGANTGFVITDQGVLAIDAKMSAEASKLELAEIAKLTPKTVAVMILTHSDLDHVNGLGGFPREMVIHAHIQTRKDMEIAFSEPSLQTLLPYLPTMTFGDFATLTLGRTIVELRHYGPAHTSGDVVVFFPKEKVAFVGDLAFIGRDPLIHLKKGGSSFGLVKTLQEILKLEAEVFIPGHGDKIGKPEIGALLKSIQDRQSKVQALVAEGKTLEDVKMAFGIKDETGAGGRRWPSLVEIIYQELTEKK